MRRHSQGGRSDRESDVVEAFWSEPDVHGELIHEFPVPAVLGDPRRDRKLDGVIVAGRLKRRLPRASRVPLVGRDIWVVQAKSGRLDFGVLGQALFGSRLIERAHENVRVTPVAAAILPNPPIEAFVAGLPAPLRMLTRAYPHLTAGSSSAAASPRGLREASLASLAAERRGLLVRIGNQRSPRDFARIRVRGHDAPLSVLEAAAIHLPERTPGVLGADTELELDPSERVEIVHSSTNVYMTFLGKAVFTPEFAARQLGLQQASSLGYYEIDNPVLRELAAEFPRAELIGIRAGD